MCIGLNVKCLSSLSESEESIFLRKSHILNFMKTCQLGIAPFDADVHDEASSQFAPELYESACSAKQFMYCMYVPVCGDTYITR